MMDLNNEFATLQQQGQQTKLPQQVASTPQTPQPVQVQQAAHSALTPGATFAGRMAQQGGGGFLSQMPQLAARSTMPQTGNGMTRTTAPLGSSPTGAAQALHTPQDTGGAYSAVGGSMTAESQAGAGFLRGGPGSMSQAQFGGMARPMRPQSPMGQQPGAMNGLGPRPVQPSYSTPQQVAQEGVGARFNPGAVQRPGGVNGASGGGFLGGGM